MVNYHPRFRQLLQIAEVPVYYEKFVEKVDTPCITYYESANNTTATGDTLTYSYITYQIKIYAETIEETQMIFEKLDRHLHLNGLTRTSANEMLDSGMVIKILRYAGIGYEYEV